MFVAGVIIFLIGCIMWIWLRLSSHFETKALAPQRIGERVFAIRLMKQKRRLNVFETYTMLVIGSILILINDIFN